MPYTHEDLQRAKVTYAAKRFADELRKHPAYAQPIPEGDIEKFSDTELALYNETLILRGCMQRKTDFYWEYAGF